MKRADVVAFARRDWRLIDEIKASYWVERKRTLPPAEAIRLGDDLRRYVLAVRPAWPSEADRDDDLSVHVRVAEALSAVSQHRPR
ncbi:MAG: hypothetical protein HYS05_20665 [Acidobacteria bacterium]|nr:hypothetical protein [Acidobacteriota bacterium]